MAGIKETSEIIKLAGLVAVFAAKKLKDGVQFRDAKALLDLILEDPEFKQALSDAVTDAYLVLEEVRDLDVFEGVSLGRQAVGIVSDVVEEING